MNVIIRTALVFTLISSISLTACVKKESESGSGSDAETAIPTPPGKYLIVLNKSGDTAWQIDAETGEKIKEYSTGTAPHEVALSPDNKRAAVTNYGNGAAGHTISVIDLIEQRIIKTIDTEPFKRPHGVQWFDDGRRIIVTAEAQQSVIVIDVDTGEIVKSIKTNEELSHMVVLDTDQDRAVVPNIGTGTVSVLDLKTQGIIKTIKTGSGSEGIALVKNENEFWVTNRASNTISVIDADSLTISETLVSTDFPIRAVTSPNGRYVAVSNARSGKVTVFDPYSRNRIAKFNTLPNNRTDGAPIGMSFSSDSRLLFVANSNADNISVFDTSSWTIDRVFDAGKTPDGIAYFIVE